MIDRSCSMKQVFTGVSLHLRLHLRFPRSMNVTRLKIITNRKKRRVTCPSSDLLGISLRVFFYHFFYSLPYNNIFGGAGSFSKEHFQLINGFSNQFWGWGGEDDDLYKRYLSHKIQNDSAREV